MKPHVTSSAPVTSPLLHIFLVFTIFANIRFFHVSCENQEFTTNFHTKHENVQQGLAPYGAVVRRIYKNLILAWGHHQIFPVRTYMKLDHIPKKTAQTGCPAKFAFRRQAGSKLATLAKIYDFSRFFSFFTITSKVYGIES